MLSHSRSNTATKTHPVHPVHSTAVLVRFLRSALVLVLLGSGLPIGGPPSLLGLLPLQQAVAASLPGSTFEIDGNTAIDTVGNTDWGNTPTATDLCNSLSDDIHINSAKEDDNLPAVGSGQPPAKSDLCSSYIRADTVGSNVFLYLGFTRFGTTGNVTVDYELNQVLGSRTINDRIVVFNLATNGSIDFKYYTWNGTQWTGPTAFNTSIAIAQMSGTNTFGEAAINLTSAGFFPTNPAQCQRFTTVTTRSRSADTISTSLQDYIVPVTIPTISNCPDITVTKTDNKTQIDAGTANSYTIVISNVGPVTVTNAIVNDTLPAAFSGATWNCTAVSPNTCSTSTFQVIIRPGGVVTYTVSGTVNSNATGTLTNTVTVTGTPLLLDANPLNNTAVDTTAIRLPDLTISKAATPSPATAGRTLTYTIAVTNSGSGPASNVTLSDTLPTGLTFQSYTSTPANACTGTTLIQCSFGTLVAGGTASVQIVALVGAGVVSGTQLINTAAISTTSNESNTGNNQASVTTPVVRVSDLSIAKTHSNPVIAGTRITYTITVNNVGPSNVNGAIVSDTVPASISGVTWTCAASGGSSCTAGPVNASTINDTVNILVGGQLIYTVAGNLAAAATGNLVNVAQVIAPNTSSDPIQSNNIATDTVAINTNAALGIVKTGPASVIPGQNATYVITVSNAGPSDAPNTTITDPAPAGLNLVDVNGAGCASLPCNIGTLLAGQSRTITVTFAVPSSYLAPNPFVNTASVTSSNHLTPETASATTSVTPNADLAISKGSVFNAAIPGTQVNFTVTVVNNGPSDAQNVVVQDPTPDGLTAPVTTDPPCIGATLPCNLGTIAAGATRQFIVTYTVPADYAGLDVTNVATVTATTPDAISSNNVATSSLPSTPIADLSISKYGPATVFAGNEVTYTIIVTNNGPSAATGVVVADPSQAGLIWQQNSGACVTAFPCNIGTLPAGSSITILARFLVPSNFPAPGPVTNIVTVTAPADPSPNSASATTDVQGLSALNISKAGPAFAVPGLTVVYTVVVTNTGPSDAQNVVVNDPAPAGLTLVSNSGDCVVAYPCTFALLPVGGSRTIVSTFSIPSNYAATADDITNIATATSLFSVEPVTATVVTPVIANADLEISKYDAPDPVVAGTQLTYTLVITNHGPSDAQDIAVDDTLPAGVTLVSASGTGWNCTLANPVACTLATLAGGASSSIVIVVNVAAATTGTLINTAEVGSETPDSNQNNNSDTANTTVQVVTQIEVSKIGPATATPGAVVNYTVIVSNTGPSNALNVVVTETVPTFTSYTGAGWTCAPDPNAGSICTQTIGTLIGGGTTQLPFQVTVLNPLPVGASQFDNVVIAGGPSITPTLPYTVSTDLIVVRGLALSKSDGGLVATPGGLVTYTLRYTNTGNIGLSNVVLQETVPDHSTFVGPNTWQGCAIGSPAGTICTINLGDVPGSGALGSTGAVQFVVKVDTPLPAGTTQLQNFASITAREGTNAQANDNTPITTFVNLQLSKEADIASAVPGGFINYTLRYTNTGNIEVLNVPLQEVVPANTVYVGSGWTCVPNANAGSICTRTIASILGGGGNGSVAFAVQVNGTVPANTNSITNTATLNESINATVVTPLIVRVGIALSKSDGGISSVPGGLVTYTIRYTNTGNAGLTGVTLAEVVPLNANFVRPAGWSCAANAPAGTPCNFNVGSLAALASGAVQFIVRVNTPLAMGVNQINNTVIADSNEEAGGSAGDSTPINTIVQLNLAKTDGGITARPGDTVVYTLTYSNSGNVATDATLTETVPANSTFSSAGSTAGWDCANNAPAGTVCHLKVGILSGGSGGTVKFAVHVNTPVPAGTTQINNTAIFGGLGSPNVSALDNTPLETFTDVRVSKTDGDISTIPGGTVVYTLTYSNLGNIGATSVVVTEVVPANTQFVASASSAGWSCADGSVAGTTCTMSLGTLNGSASGTLRFAVRLSAILPAGVQQILNGAFIGSNEGPGTAGSDTTPVIAATDVSVTKSDGNITALPGAVVIYTLTVRNDGNIGTANMVLTETVPANTTYVAANSSTGWSCADGAVAGTVCTLSIGALAGGGATLARQFAVRIANPMPAGVSSVANTVIVGEVGQPPQPPVTEVTPVNVSANLRILKTVANPQVIVGGRVTYTIQVFNDGPGLALNAVMSDVLVSGLLFQSLVVPTGWTCTTPAVGASGVVRCVNAQFAVGSASFTLVAQANSTLPNGTVLNNTATVLGSTPVNTPTVSTPEVPIVIVSPVLVVGKSADPANGTRVRNDDLITYTLVVTNQGDAAATNVLIADAIPTGTQYVNGSASPVLAGGPSPLRWSFASLEPGESRSVRFTVRVTETAGAESGVTAIENIGTGISDQTPLTTSNRVVHVFDRTAIHLLNFAATRQNNGVLVRWTTDLELDTFGFDLYRSSGSQGRASAVRITPSMIAATGRNGGATYEFLDTTASATETYHYWLQEVELDGEVIDYGPTSILASGSASIYLPFVIKP